jgi:hypothetical protein
MPIPKPEKGELEKDYISRCMKEIGSEYDDPAQGVAVCYANLRKERGESMSTQAKIASKINQMNLINELKFAGECPPETQDIALNLKNRQKAIDEANYGPENPNEPNEDYWKKKADMFQGDIESAKKALCGNCSFFDQTKKILDCIASGIGGEDAWDTIDAGDLGLCTAFDFKCAAKRTCDAWVIGGPIKD